MTVTTLNNKGCDSGFRRERAESLRFPASTSEVTYRKTNTCTFFENDNQLKTAGKKWEKFCPCLILKINA